MSRARTLGREARQRLPDGPEAAGKADIAGIPSTKAAKPKKPYITVKPAAGGSPNDLSGIPAIVMRSLVTVTAVCVDDGAALRGVDVGGNGGDAAILRQQAAVGQLRPDDGHDVGVLNEDHGDPSCFHRLG